MNAQQDGLGFWSNITSFYHDFDVPINVVFIVVGALIARWVLGMVIHRVVHQIVSGVKRLHNVDDTQALATSPVASARIVQRTKTIGSVLNSLVTWTIVVVAFTMILTAVHFNVTAVVASAGVIAAGLAFGAQNIVKDMLSGLFIVLEDQLGVGDVVDLGSATGVVEAVGIRVTQVRDVNGTLWFVRNGEIVRVGNMSQGWARVIIDLAVPYEADIDAVQTTMLDVANTLTTTPQWRPQIMEKPELWGLESIAEDAIVIRLVVKTRTATKDSVARELRARLKKALDEMGVHLPSLATVVLSGFDGATSVTGAKPPRNFAPPARTGSKPRAPRRGKRNHAPPPSSGEPHS